ncbi:hypothetical protein [Oryza sativa Japonica Group]|uniref:Uncharacterized protein n=1 Tax=Oryza sativa subsp. japonica TaxID=39947 RepID=Q657H5_ORYSJ|nr:hypothetical protein [Oryza sativa Japonica Group]BAD45042.1 hypothetical protein [Oryza sativa Japonica Group]
MERDGRQLEWGGGWSRRWAATGLGWRQEGRQGPGAALLLLLLMGCGQADAGGGLGGEPLSLTVAVGREISAAALGGDSLSLTVAVDGVNVDYEQHRLPRKSATVISARHRVRRSQAIAANLRKDGPTAVVGDIFSKGPLEGLIRILNYVRYKSRVQQGSIMYLGWAASGSISDEELNLVMAACVLGISAYIFMTL